MVGEGHLCGSKNRLRCSSRSFCIKEKWRKGRRKHSIEGLREGNLMAQGGTNKLEDEVVRN